MEFKETRWELPEPDPIEEQCNTYYIVRVKQYGVQRAMYLRNEEGEDAWYSDYYSKIIRPVTHWMEVV